ncbi:uncharacterized protein VP01_8841g1 [Puccinia sorghi]|uniref:Uncharacterized protein n=1 Tax=Puccinia sorghi TaxID=27349 RepID=A0A0L6U8A5_9BASI|nr:uncharacterized protein VP01_8841g1 [Puccinia sorghi]
MEECLPDTLDPHPIPSHPKSLLFGYQADHHQGLESLIQHDTDGTASKPALVGARTGQYNQSEGTEGRTLPLPSHPRMLTDILIRSWCHNFGTTFTTNTQSEYSTFAVDDETLNILIDIFALSIMQDGQGEFLLPKRYLTRVDIKK